VTDTRPPSPPPERTDTRLRWALGLFAAFLVLTVTGSILAGAHVHHHTALIVAAFTAAGVSLIASAVVLAGGGQK
jgi:hypothetical protein